MKHTLAFYLFFLFLLWGGETQQAFAQKFKPKYLRLSDKSLLTYTSNASEDGWLEFKADAALDISSFPTKFAKNIGIGEGYQLRLARDKTDIKETRHQHYQLYYKNLPVEGGHLDLHSRKGQLTAAHSRIVEDIDLAVDKIIQESKALEAILADRKQTLADLKDNIPKGQLVVTNLGGDFTKETYRLAYYFDIAGKGKNTDQNADELLTRIYVDAVTGQLLKKVSLVNNCFGHDHSPQSSVIKSNPNHASEFARLSPLQSATFNSLHPRSNPNPSFEVESASQGGYRLTMSTSTPQALQTRWDLNNNTLNIINSSNNPNMDLAWDDPEVTNPSLNWGNNVQQATLAHWTVWRAHQYFQSRFGMNGTDGQGGIARILIAPSVPNNATWFTNYRMMVIGQHLGTILSSVDIVGHEYGHGVSSNLVAGWWRTNAETAALNEGFSDIIGTAIERELYPTGGPNDIWNYRIGEDAWYIRNMANPHDFGDPWTYQEPGYWDFGNEEHRNAGVLDKWFHTLTEGSGPNFNNISPISFDDAMSIVYWALDNYIYGDYNYPNTAQAIRAAAGQLYGQCSPQQNAVIAALGAVNLPVGACTPDCNYAAVNISPSSVNCNQGITLSANCTGATANNNVWTCQNVTYSFTGPNVPYNSGTGSSINVTTPATAGNYQYSLTMSKPNSGCYAKTYNFNISVNCGGGNSCDFSSGPRYVGTWNGLIVQIRNISGHNVLVTAIPNSSTDKYYPRGDNFWGNFNLDPGAAGLQSCLNAGTTAWYGLTNPGGLNPPSGYYQGAESDGAVFFAQNGTNPPNPCDASPRHVGTWNGLNVEIRTFPNGKHALVTAVVGSSNDKYYVRGDNFWDNFTKDGGVDQYRACLNAGDTDWWGMAFPGGIAPPSGYQQGTSSDGAVYFSTNGLRAAAPELVSEEVTLVKVHPNPVQEEVTVTFILKEAGPVQLRILDLQGRVQQQRNEKGVAGKNERTLAVGSLATGLYALEVTFEGQRVIHKLVKQ